MKKLLLLIVCINSFCFAQKNEVKFNLAKILDVSYERKMSHHFSSGLHLGTGLYKLNDDVQNRMFIKMYGRYYLLRKQDFNKLYVQLSFIHNEDEYFPVSNPSMFRRVGWYDENAITIGFGYKFLIRKKITVDMYVDLGPEFSHPEALLPLFGDLGLNIGYRF